MSPALLSLLALLLVVAASLTSRVNVGVLAVALAWGIATFAADWKVDQLMAVFPSSLFLTLLGVTLWLKRSGKKYWFAAGPMVVVMAITLTALSLQIVTGVRAALEGRWTLDSGAINPAVLNGLVAVLLAGLAGVFVIDGLFAGLRGQRRHTSHHPER